ncbi:MAG TPA: BatA domain-containing protein [Gemmatimonadales bacterium]
MISFAAPWALAGLAAAVIPILLHLFARREPPEVEFPAVRYLSETARVHQHRLNIQHLLLLLARTLLIIALVLAAAGPTSPSGSAGSHAPTALVLMFDNSLSSGATAGGVPVLDRLREVARGVFDRATPADVLWLITAEGVARRGTGGELRRVVDSLSPSPRRLDLGETLGLARDLLAGERLPGEVIVVTDQQASALSPARGEGPVTVVRPDEPLAPNAGVAAIATGPQPWTAAGGAVTVYLAGADTSGVPLALTVGTRRARQALAAPDRPVTLPLQVAERGWVPLTVELAPDEVRGDDRWTTVLRVAPAARVRWSDADRYLAAAFDVLRESGRVVPGGDLTVGGLGPGPSLVLPPSDVAQLGSLNRALAARGVTWRYGARSSTPARTDSSTTLLGSQALLRYHPLESAGSGEAGVLIRAGGIPWLVRTGDVVLAGSRFDPEWTSLPLSAEFVPFLDAMVNRVVRGEIAAISAAPGDAVTLPDGTQRVGGPGGEVAVEGGALFRPALTGLYFLLSGRDTLGTVSVNPDPRESVLTRATDRAVEALWRGARTVSLEQGARLAFTAAARRDLRPPLLWLALVLGVVEAGLAAWRRHQ